MLSSQILGKRFSNHWAIGNLWWAKSYTGFLCVTHVLLDCKAQICPNCDLDKVKMNVQMLSSQKLRKRLSKFPNGSRTHDPPEYQLERSNHWAIRDLWWAKSYTGFLCVTHGHNWALQSGRTCVTLEGHGFNRWQTRKIFRTMSFNQFQIKHYISTERNLNRVSQDQIVKGAIFVKRCSLWAMKFGTFLFHLSFK